MKSIYGIVGVHIGKTKCYLITSNGCRMVQYLMVKVFLNHRRLYNFLHCKDFCVQLQAENHLTSFYFKWLNIMGCILGELHI